MKEIRTETAPLPIGPYSQGVISSCDEMVFTAGQIAIPSGESDVRGDTTEEQARIAIQNIREILQAAGCKLGDVVKVTVYLKEMDDYPALNRIYAEAFSTPPFPARSVVEVSRLPKGALVEIEVIARRRRD
jgi:2-iminobutanoate/2-iminopropanoate deaminase